MSEHCLALQDSSGVDVNLLLYAAWRGSLGDALGGQQFEQLGALTREWRETVIQPLRELRRANKTLAPLVAEAIAGAELAAERHQQDELFQAAIPGAPERGSVSANLDSLQRWYGDDSPLWSELSAELETVLTSASGGVVP